MIDSEDLALQWLEEQFGDRLVIEDDTITIYRQWRRTTSPPIPDDEYWEREMGRQRTLLMESINARVDAEMACANSITGQSRKRELTETLMEMRAQIDPLSQG